MKGKAKHSLQDLNEYLFDELDALTNGDLQGEQLNAEIERSKAIVQVAGRIAGKGIRKNRVRSRKQRAKRAPEAHVRPAWDRHMHPDRRAQEADGHKRSDSRADELGTGGMTMTYLQTVIYGVCIVAISFLIHNIGGTDE